MDSDIRDEYHATPNGTAPIFSQEISLLVIARGGGKFRESNNMRNRVSQLSSRNVGSANCRHENHPQYEVLSGER